MPGSSQALSRTTLMLMLATLAAIAIAAYVIVSRNAEREPTFAPRLMFPNLTSEVEAVQRISVQTSTGSFDVVRNEDGAWHLPSRADYPASSQLVRSTILGLTALELIEEKTARPERHGSLGLVAPDKGGDGILMSMLGKDDDVIATLIIGKTQRVEGVGKPRTIYVRYPDEDQTWLAKTTLTTPDDALDWIDKEVVDIERDDIAAVEITHAGDKPYRLERGSGDDFTLVNPPKSRTVKPAYTLNTTAYALNALQVLDVKPAAEVDFGKASHAYYETLNRVAIDLDLVEVDDGYWMRLKATVMPPAPPPAAPPAPETAAPPESEAATTDATAPDATASDEDKSEPSPEVTAASLNSRTDGWAYAIPDFKYNQLTTKRDDLIEPLDSAAKDNKVNGQ